MQKADRLLLHSYYHRPHLFQSVLSHAPENHHFLSQQGSDKILPADEPSILLTTRPNPLLLRVHVETGSVVQQSNHHMMSCCFIPRQERLH